MGVSQYLKERKKKKKEKREYKDYLCKKLIQEGGHKESHQKQKLVQQSYFGMPILNHKRRNKDSKETTETEYS